MPKTSRRIISLIENLLEDHSQESAYKKLVKLSKKLVHLVSAQTILKWDSYVGMPKESVEDRAQTLFRLSRTRSQVRKDGNFKGLLAQVKAYKFTEDPIEAANIREWVRIRAWSKRKSKDPNMNIAKMSSEAVDVWMKTKNKNDWKTVLPYLKRNFEILKNKALAGDYENEPYDALLDHYEPGMTTKKVQSLFDTLIPFLRDLLDKIKASSDYKDVKEIKGNFPVKDKRKFAEDVISRMGYDLKRGLIAIGSHSITLAIEPNDVRLLIRQEEPNFSQLVFAAFHESAHGMYHQNLPFAYWGTPVCNVASAGINESQGRMWSNQITRALPFWKYFYPKAQKCCPDLKNYNVEEFFKSTVQVQPTLMRTEADEVTYNLHVGIRFELELAIIRGDLKVEDLPGEWNKKYKEYLGIVPSDYKRGVMQDMQWYYGQVGYFPTYLLGNIFAAQFYHKIREDISDLDDQLEHGSFSDLFNWCKKKIYQKGRILLPNDLMVEATGEPANTKYLMTYLKEKYSKIYNIK